MGTSGFGLISLTVFLPLIGALVLLLMPEQYAKAIKGVAFLFTVVTFVASLAILGAFQGGTYHFQLVEQAPWIASLGISYKVGVDGVSIWLIMLTTLLLVVSVWFSFYVKTRPKAYFIYMLLLGTAMLGVFTSLDLILFYTFFEASLVPMYFLIAIWGGEQRRYAANKFLIYTFAASIFMLVGMIALAVMYQKSSGVLTFDLVTLQHAVSQGKLWAGDLGVEALIFWAFALAFMVKCPMFPFHTWLPDAHTEAPTAGSVILAAVLLKMGTYGFIRFSLPIFPDVVGAQAPYILGLAVIGIVYGAIVAAVQPDLKRLVAYSSVAHMGFAMLGIFSLTHTGMVGGAFIQLAHGISTGGLFLLVGLLYERLHTRMFKDFGGLKAQMPLYAALFLIIMLSSLGLPGTNGFVGEFLAGMGAFEACYAGAFGLNIGYSILACAGLVLAAVYLLWMFQKVFYGENTHPINHRLKDLKVHEVVLVGILVVFVFWGGLYPNTFIKPMEASLGAARLMALGPELGRPSWQDMSQEIDPDGNLVKVERAGGPDLSEYTVRQTVTNADLHFPLEADENATSTPDFRARKAPIPMGNVKKVLPGANAPSAMGGGPDNAAKGGKR